MTQERYPYKILIVEDESAISKTLLDNLMAAGFMSILQASNGEEGLAMALKEKPDLILLDIIMPKMDGLAMLKALRKNPQSKGIKVIFLTNLMTDDAIINGIVADEPSYYLVKADHSIDDVVQKVKETLGIEDPSSIPV